VEIGIGVKPTRTSRHSHRGRRLILDQRKFMAVGIDKNAVSLAHGDGVEDVATPRLAVG
jgi:hypothetical protein